jgi:hypothetical protein
MKANFKQIVLGLGIGTLAYYIANKMLKKKGEATSKVEGGFGNGINFADANGVDFIDGEFYNADGDDFYSADGDFYDADGDFFGADGSFTMPEGGYGNGIGFMDANGVDEYSNAKGKAKGKKKRGKSAGLKRQLAIWQKKVRVLTSAKQKIAPKLQKRIAQITRKMNARVDKKLAHAQRKVAQITQKLQNSPSNG